jgi:hypothetical protein
MWLYVFNRVANAFRQMLGMKLVIADYTAGKCLLLHFTGLRRIKYITCARCDGQGAGFQAVMIMLAMNFARRAGIPFAYTPLTELEHAEGAMDQYVASWENTLNLGRGEINIESIEGPATDFMTFYYGYTFRQIFLKPLYDDFAQTGKYFKRKFTNDLQEPRKDTLTVGVHFRRGDVSPSQVSYMWTGLDELNSTLNDLDKILKSCGFAYQIFITSQGSRDYFDDIDVNIDRFYLDEDAISSFCRLVDSDILVMAKSYFSYSAALLSDGISMFRPWLLEPGETFPAPVPQQGWIGCDPAGYFDVALFRTRLESLIEQRRLG